MMKYMKVNLFWIKNKVMEFTNTMMVINIMDNGKMI